MASQQTARAPRSDDAASPSQDFWPEGFTQHKLYRLLELRAVIDAMHYEREAPDPLLAWVTGRGRADVS
jgi:hypothetical protein